MWLLMNVDYETGEGIFGRNQIVKGTGLNSSTVYKVTSRLQTKYQVLSKQSNNHFTQISVLNWAKYQHHEEKVTSTVQTKEHVPERKGNTPLIIKEIKNIKKEASREYLISFPIDDFSDIDATEKQLRLEGEKAYNWCLAKGTTKKNYKAFLRNWVLKSFKKKSLEQPKQEYSFDPSGIARLAEVKQKLVIKTMH